jgi:CubicO group peptidase (beta-lactamase class C family)
MVMELDGIVGDGTVNSTTGDLWKWSRALDRHQLVPAKVQEEIFTAARTADGKEQFYGYGWGLGKDSIFGTFVSHSGGWPGYGTYIEKHLEKGYTIILLSNHDRPEVKLKWVRNILYGVKEQEKQTIQVDEKDLKEYPGTYQIDPEFSITITIEGQQVFAQATGQDKFGIFAEKKDLFFLKDVEAKIRFERDASGKVSGLVLLQNGQEAPGKKIK